MPSFGCKTSKWLYIICQQSEIPINQTFIGEHEFTLTTLLHVEAWICIWNSFGIERSPWGTTWWTRDFGTCLTQTSWPSVFLYPGIRVKWRHKNDVTAIIPWYITPLAELFNIFFTWYRFLRKIKNYYISSASLTERKKAQFRKSHGP